MLILSLNKFWRWNLEHVTKQKGFPYSSVSKESACSSGDPGSIPGLGRSPGEGNGDPLQYPCLENLMDRGAWGLQSMGLQRIGYNSAINTYLLTYLSEFPITSPTHLWGVRNPQRVPSLWLLEQSFPKSHRHWPHPAMLLPWGLSGMNLLF